MKGRKEGYSGLEKHPEASMAQGIFLKDDVENGLPGTEVLGSFE